MRQISLGVAAATQDAAKSYEEAIRALNTLQSNAAVLEKVRAERDKKRHLSLPDTIKMAERAGVPMSSIDDLSIIHVSGTKGKGSTCAFCESILKTHGYRTGFFSSPHLVEVRERIRINGRPLSRKAFSTYFWDCFSKLDATKDSHQGAMPPYFRFLTIMAFHVFIQEKVDVAIMEVGIGGEYDCTNIINQPVVCGVSSLGIDHTSLLGDTLPKIAWHKAGIFKPGVPAVTVNQPEDAMEILIQRAKERGCELTVAPTLEQYEWTNGVASPLGIPGAMQDINSSLALQLSRKWLEKQGTPRTNSDTKHSPGSMAEAYEISPDTARGLKECQWLGRSQTVRHPGLTYYLDGAHTAESIKACSDWFSVASKEEQASVQGSVARILVFNTTGDRRPETLLEHLVGLDFACAIFCPNIASISSNKADQTNYTVSLQSQLARCSLNRNSYLDLLKMHKGPEGRFVDRVSQRLATDKGSADHFKYSVPESPDSGIESGGSCSSSVRTTPDLDPIPTFTFNCILDGLLWASQGRDPILKAGSNGDQPIGLPQKLLTAKHLQVLCTGSLHLVGGVISLVCPLPDDD